MKSHTLADSGEKVLPGMGRLSFPVTGCVERAAVALTVGVAVAESGLLPWALTPFQCCVGNSKQQRTGPYETHQDKVTGISSLRQSE